MAGEIGRRINDLIYKNYIVIDAGSLFAAYTGDPKVAGQTSRLIDGIIKHMMPARCYAQTELYRFMN